MSLAVAIVVGIVLSLLALAIAWLVRNPLPDDLGPPL